MDFFLIIIIGGGVGFLFRNILGTQPAPGIPAAPKTSIAFTRGEILFLAACVRVEIHENGGRMYPEALDEMKALRAKLEKLAGEKSQDAHSMQMEMRRTQRTAAPKRRVRSY